MKAAVIITIFIVSAAVVGTAEEDEHIKPSLSLTVLSEKPFTIGDPIDIALTIHHEKKARILFPTEEGSFLPFILNNSTVKRKRTGRGLYKTTVIYSLTLLQTGNVELKPLDVIIDDLTLQTEPLIIPILSVLPKDEENPELKDIIPPYRARMKTVTFVIILSAIAAAFILFMMLSRYLFKKIRKEGRTAPPETPFDPYAYSLNKLEDLKRAHSRNQAEEKEVYTSVSYILRLYFGSLLGINALEMTTTELRKNIKRRDFTYIHPVRLLNILKRSDMVKFAKERPPRKTVEEDIDGSIGMIKEVQTRVNESHQNSDERDDSNGV